MKNLTETQFNAGHAIGGRGTSSKARILVVDDDPIIRDLHSAVLHLDNYDVETAQDGEEALERLARERFQLVVTDRAMPKLDGVNLIRKIRATGNRVPIVMVSGSLLDSELPQDVASEVAAALPKPALVQQVLAAVAFALKGPDGWKARSVWEPQELKAA